MSLTHRSVLSLALALSFISPLAAQDSAATAADSTAARLWHAFYISGSPGWGMLIDTCSGSCSPTNWGSTCCLTLNVRAGYALGTRWALGLENDNAVPLINTQAVIGGGFAPPGVAFYSLAGTYYPSETSRVWISLDAGIALHTPSDVSFSRGFSAGVGLGYDWLPGHGGFAIIPTVNFQRQFTGGQLSGTSSFYRATLLQLAIGFGYHH